jgi:aspartyl-tRNA(Asn)/glutamyl-tRNA(Gln) amidotransferase subunit A
MRDADLLYLPATKVAAMIRRRAFSPVDYIEVVLAAIERAQPQLNAFAAIMAEEARRDAKAAEAAVMSGAPLGSLHGVPVNVKDQVNTAGVRTAHGTAIHANNIPARDDICVARLRAAGAIVVGKTTLPEFGHKGLTDSPTYGITRNPWDSSRTPGGSSGGAAAAVAAGLTPLGLGTDGAGSIRIPAACCGLVGLKPTLGAVPWENAIDGFFNYTYAGPLARTVTDAAVMHAVLSGPSPLDPWSLTGKDQGRVSPMLIGDDLWGLHVGYIARTANPRVDPEVEANTDSCLNALSDLGAMVDEVTDEIDWMELSGRIMYQGNFAVACAQFLPEWQSRMDPVLLAFMERGRAFTMTQFREAQYARTRLFRAIQTLFERYDLLVTPTLTRTALPVSFDAANDEVEVDGEKCGITRQGWTSYVYPFNLTGHPALTVPSGFASDGLPTGVQLVGKWGSDLDVLRVGALIERARPWAQRRPQLPG